MTVEARAPCGDCNNNNNNNNDDKVISIVILIKLTTEQEIIFICKQESARGGDLSKDRFMTPRQ
jgi:hypothetical protein